MAQPITVTLSSSGSSPWKIVNWHASPINLTFALTASGLNGTAQVDVMLSDPSSVYPSTTQTVFQASQVSTSIAASSLSQIGSISVPISAWRLTQNASGATQLVVLQSGIGG